MASLVLSPTNAMDEETSHDERTLVDVAKEALILQPYHILTSRPAQRAYINSVLLSLTALLLAAVAIFAYSFFYYTYIPQIGFERPVHLQFGQDVHPWGVVSLGAEDGGSSVIASLQRYDVKVVLDLPRTRANLETGNFMVEVALLGPVPTRDGELENVLARSSRAAIMTYRSPVVELVARVARLPWYLAGWRQEAERMEVGMMEGVEFKRGWRNLPTRLRLEVQSQGQMQLYAVRVEFRARLAGLRWLMYNHRVFSFAFLTAVFWSVEMTFALTIWIVISVLFFSSTKDPTPTSKSEPQEDGEIKSETAEDHDLSEGLSDTSRTFPTYSGQPPLRYSSSKVKKEEDEEGKPPAPPLHATTLEADDEDEDADFVIERGGGFTDSGLGTSMESSGARSDSVRKRKKAY